MALGSGERKRLVEAAGDIILSGPARRPEKKSSSNLSALLEFSGHGRKEGDCSSGNVAAFSAAQVSSPRMDENSNNGISSRAVPASRNCNQADAATFPQESSPKRFRTRSALTSYFTSDGKDNNHSGYSNSGRDDKSGSSTISGSSFAATQRHSSREASSSISSDINNLDFSGSFVGKDVQALLTSYQSTGSPRKASTPRDHQTLVNGGQKDDVSDWSLIGGSHSFETIHNKPPQSSSTAIESNSPLCNSSQLLSEWNESPFVSSYPNHHPQLMEVSCDDWSSQGLPWHINLQEVVTGDIVATGSYGMVFKGIYKEQKVAVKILLIPEASSKRELEKLKSNFQKEIDLWYKLSHPNIVQFVGAYVGSPKWAIVTEFLHGGSIRSYLSRQQRKGLPVTVVHSMALDIARGMAYLHQNSIMHRDLKSANLLLDESGGVKVADFGLARGETEDAGNLTAETGTIRWMAPEVICHMPYSRKIDVYSYGIVLWELCTSLVPYEGMSFVQLAHAVANDHHRPPTSGVPSPFAKLMRQCWDRDATRRPDFAVIVKYLETNVIDDIKCRAKGNQTISRVEKQTTVDAYCRPTTSMRKGRVLNGKRNIGLASLPKTDETLSDDEDWVSIRKQCRCSIM